ncbi:hypothetical protein M413DRAFT_372490 [Hebeloma cylindrosporum]|uniref:non-specific serine/threonine protein kinase n=1 Tax=Hebeloma cylindrosporum TaxID=76867 RepID=A0A0C3CJQ1_HEBCY|nr:hypothetical protein M413DRAFT_372490 [Hebeloma cylindrosporum h7]
MESIQTYRPGGYHPVLIGDIFHDRYQVVNKLGSGAYSTVRIVDDLRSGRFASLKIVIASALVASRERDVARHLKQAQEGTQKNSPGREFVMEVLDDFLLHGPNGIHLCIVSELLGPSILQGPGIWEEHFEDHIEEFPPAHAKRICVQMAEGLAYLHRCNIVHGGKENGCFLYTAYKLYPSDLNHGNLVLRIPGVERWTRQEVEKYFGQPRKRQSMDKNGNVIQSANVPEYLVVRPDPDLLIQLCIESIENFNIKLCDLGEAFIWDGIPKDIRLHMPHIIAAPEVLLRAPLTPSIDVWALACAMYMLLKSSHLFTGNSRDQILASMVSYLGKFPMICGSGGRSGRSIQIARYCVFYLLNG